VVIGFNLGGGCPDRKEIGSIFTGWTGVFSPWLSRMLSANGHTLIFTQIERFKFIHF